MMRSAAMSLTRIIYQATAALGLSAALAHVHGAEITRSHRDASGEAWSLSLSTDGFLKLADATPVAAGVANVVLRFPRAAAPEAEALLKKFRQWSALAEKNAVAAAERELGLSLIHI